MRKIAWLVNLLRRRLWGVIVTMAAGLIVVFIPAASSFSYDFMSFLPPGGVVNDVVLIYVDEKSLDELGREPDYTLSRTNHVRLIDRLTAEKSKVVLYDLAFLSTNATPEVDAQLAAAIRQNGRVVLVGALRQEQIREATIEINLPPIPILETNAAGWGHAALDRRVCGVVRRISGWRSGVPYVVDTAHAVASGSPTPTALPERWLNYYGGKLHHPFPTVSFSDALSTNTPTDFFRGKSVIVGKSLVVDSEGERRDEFITPHTRFAELAVPGAFIHATALANVMRGDWLHRMPVGLQVILSAMWGLVVWLFLRVKSKGKWSLALAVALAVALMGLFSWVLQAVFNVWWSWFGAVCVQPGLALLAVLIARPPYLAFICYRRNPDEQNAKQIRDGLMMQGYGAFLDLTDLGVTEFSAMLERGIDESEFFIILISPTSLDRCTEERDVYRQELEYAARNGKPVIPVLTDGFVFEQADPHGWERTRWLAAQNGLALHKDLTTEEIVRRLLQKIRRWDAARWEKVVETGTQFFRGKSNTPTKAD